MSESRPPLPLILAATVAVLVLTLVGINVLRDSDATSTALDTKPAPSVARPSAAPEVVDAVPADAEASSASSAVLTVARQLLSGGDEASALDVVENGIEDVGPEPALLRFREALMQACETVLEREKARIESDISLGKTAEARERLAALLTRLPGTYQSELAQLRSTLYAPGVNAKAQRLELEQRARELTQSPTPEGYYELALWARDRGFAAESRGFMAKTVALDGFHEGARKALGHRQHEGRWYSDDEFKRDVLGLIKGPDGRWLKKAEPKPDEPKAVAKKKVPVGRMMDKYFKRFRSVFKNFLPPTTYERSEIYIHASKEEFHEKNPQVPKTAGGFYQPKTKRVVAFHGMFTKTMTTRDVLAHEGTHQFEDIVLQGKFWNCPIWIIEGLAVFFESAYFNGSEVKIGLVPRERLWSLKRGIATKSLIPLRTLLRTPQRQFGGYHYAHAWSLIYMVIYGDKSKKARAKKQKWFGELPQGEGQPRPGRGQDRRPQGLRRA